jgi:hypothetical protein
MGARFTCPACRKLNDYVSAAPGEKLACAGCKGASDRRRICAFLVDDLSSFTSV